MILTAAIGNSTTTVAFFREDGTIAVRATYSTDLHTTKDQYAVQLFSMCLLYQVDHREITGGIIASVVPSVTAAMSGAITQLVGRRPLIVGAGIRTGLNIRSDLHTQLGADIVAYCVGAVTHYPSPAIVVDFGTAITFSVLRNNSYEGCVIAPGVRVGIEALSRGAAALPHISLEGPIMGVLGHNTVDAMRAGATYGNACLVDGMIDRLEEATCPAAAVIATGSYADDVVPYCRKKIIQDSDLLLEGLYQLYRKNTHPKQHG